MAKRLIYLDNNATTRMCDEAATVMRTWMQSCTNASGSSQLSRAAQTLIKRAEAAVTRLCNLGTNYHILFTSGASESNSAIIRMTIDSWHKNVGGRPHIVASAVEHWSILDCLENLDCDVTLVEPNSSGAVDPAAVAGAIRENTALVTVMYANNETGTVNNVRAIAREAHARSVPFHTDAVQMFGKVAVDCPGLGIDALSMSFHKIRGPQGVGLLLIRKKFAAGYRLHAVVNGTQQHGLRGGTENISGIAAATAALVDTMRARKQKNAAMSRRRAAFLAALTIPCIPFGDAATYRGPGLAYCILGSTRDNEHLPNTI